MWRYIYACKLAKSLVLVQIRLESFVKRYMQNPEQAITRPKFSSFVGHSGKEEILERTKSYNTYDNDSIIIIISQQPCSTVCAYVGTWRTFRQTSKAVCVSPGACGLFWCVCTWWLASLRGAELGFNPLTCKRMEWEPPTPGRSMPEETAVDKIDYVLPLPVLKCLASRTHCRHCFL